MTIIKEPLIRQHIQTLFSNAPADHGIAVHRKQGDKLVSDTFPVNSVQIIQHINKHGKKYDIYISTTTVRLEADSSGATRGCADDAIGAFGIHFALDYQEETHQKDNLPSVDEALEFVNLLPLYPSLIVDSGNGLELYWQFKEFHAFDNNAARDSFKALQKDFHTMIVSQAKKQGWVLDPTQDLNGLLRPAGSRNHKVTPPFTVQIEDKCRARYTREVSRAICDMR